MRKAEADRGKLKLDQAALYAKYPTPEVTFEGEPLLLAPGAAATIHLTGHFPAGTAFLFDDDAVQVTHEKASGTGWEAQIKVAASALPSDVRVAVIAPVSGADQSVQVLRIRGMYQLDLKFADGWTAHVVPRELDKDSGNLTCDAEFKRPGDPKSPQKRSLTLRMNDGAFNGRLDANEEDQAVYAAMSEKLVAAMTPDPSTMKKIEEFAAKAGACKTEACMNKAREELTALSEAQEKKSAAAAASVGKLAAYQCASFDVAGTLNELTGKATCSGDVVLAITGSGKLVK